MKPYLLVKKQLVIATTVCIFCFSGGIFSQTADIKVETKQVGSQKTLVIKSTVPSSDMSKAMGDLFGKLFGYLGSNNIQPAGPPFAVYYDYDPKGNTVFELGVPVASETKGTNEIVYKEFPAMKVISSLYVGPYEKVGPVYEYISKYIKDNGLQISGPTWEIYLTNPGQEPDPNKYQTAIYYPVK